MGQVYRARDTRLNRDVAIKVLPDAFAGDADRLARFTREAQTLAALNHPNIAQIRSRIEESRARHGTGRGRRPVGRSSRGARSLCGRAADRAADRRRARSRARPGHHPSRSEAGQHQGPADGTVKVLDFGLAKALEPATPAASGAPVQLSDAHRAWPPRWADPGYGRVHGARAGARQVVDRRADIWAFGVVLYEMLTGRRVFEGEEVSDVLAAVLSQEIDWSALPAHHTRLGSPAAQRCLDRDPRKRLSAISDARLDIDEPDAAPAQSGTAPAPARRRSSLVSAPPPQASSSLRSSRTCCGRPRRRRHSRGPLTRLSILPPAGATLFPDSGGVAISPDGTMVVYLVVSIRQSGEKRVVGAIAVIDGSDTAR